MKLQRKLISFVVAFALILTSLLAIGGGILKISANDEMTPGGSAGEFFTISKVELLDEEGIEKANAISWYDMENASMNYKLKYTFHTENGDSVGGKELILYVPKGFSLSDVSTERDFIVNGQPQGKFTLDSGSNTIKIKFNEQVNNLRDGEFILDISTDSDAIKEIIQNEPPVENDGDGKTPRGHITINGVEIPLVKASFDLGDVPLVNKGGEVRNPGDDEDDLTDNQIRWSVAINQLKRTGIKDNVVLEDNMPGIFGDAKVVIDGISGQTDPTEITVAELGDDGLPNVLEGVTAKLNEKKNGFSLTVEPEKINGKTLILMYVVEYKNKKPEELLKIPNNITVEPSADMPEGQKISEVIDRSGGSGNSDDLGTFAENHYFFESEEEYAKGKDAASKKIEQEEPIAANEGVQISSEAFSKEALEKNGYKLVKVEAGNADTEGVVEDGNSYENFYENGKHKVVNYYYVKEKTEPVVERGTFKVVHKYYDSEKGFNTGNEPNSVEEGEKTEGSSQDKYRATSPKENEEYKLVSVDTSNDSIKKSEDGNSTTEGNYVPNEDLVVTYNYVKLGHFTEDHIYYENESDADANTNEVEKAVTRKTSGTDMENFTSSKQDKTGYKLYKVQGDPNEAEITGNEDGGEFTHTYIPGKTVNITYKYVKEKTEPVVPVEPVVEKGTFEVEHRYYESEEDLNSDKNAKVEKVEKTTGTTEEQYAPSKANEKDGYKFTKVEKSHPDNIVSGEDGKSTVAGNYVAKTDLKVTYYYVKEKTKPVEPVDPKPEKPPVEPVDPKPEKPPVPTIPTKPEKPVPNENYEGDRNKEESSVEKQLPKTGAEIPIAMGILSLGTVAGISLQFRFNKKNK